MALDGTIKQGDTSVRIQGLAKTVRALKKAGADAQDMKELMFSIGQLVVNRAIPLTPVRTGALRDSIRAGHGQTKAVVRAGSAKIPYGPVIEYGWPSHNITGVHFLEIALRDERPEVFETLDKGIDAILKKNNLK